MRPLSLLVAVIGSLLSGPALADPPAPRQSRAAARPTPSPVPAPVLEGVVRGPDGKPIAKAFVAARSESPRPGQTAVGTRTDAQGRFKLTLRDRDTQRVRAESPGLAGRTLTKVAPGTPLTIDLVPGGAIEGIVRDGDTKEPVPGVRVETRDRDAFGTADEPDAGRIVATSDAQGRFKLGGLGPGRHDVTARARGRGFAQRKAVAAGARLELALHPASALLGTITGPDGQPVADAFVTPLAYRGSPVSGERSDAQGRYAIAGLGAGLYDVAVRANGLAPGVVPDVVLDGRGEAQVDLALKPGARVVGRLVDGRAQPLAGRVTVGEIAGHPTPYVLNDVLSAQTGADGRFAIAAVPTGELALGVDAPGHAPQRVEVAVSATQRQVDLGDVRMETGLVIRGRVGTRSGQPVAEALVQASVPVGGPARQPMSHTDATGAFVLAGLEAVTYRVSAWASGFGRGEADAEPGPEPIELTLDPAGTIAGKVVDARGRPVETFRVVARPTEQGQAWAHDSFEAADGRFVLKDVAAGSYVVSVEGDASGRATVPADVATGGATDVGTVKLEPGAAVRGTVSDTAGAPVEGARIGITRPNARHTMTFGTEPDVLTDRSGAFEVKGVEPGALDVRASHPAYAPSSRVAVVIEPGQPVPDVRLVMSAGGRIEGSLRRRDGAPIAGALLGVTPVGDTRPGEATTATQADGTFTIDHVAPGPVRVTAMTPTASGSMFRSALSRDVDVREGEVTRLDIVGREVRLTGRVTRSGTPAPGLRMEAYSGSMTTYGGRGVLTPRADAGPERMTAVTREDGGFEMIVDEPGQVRLSVTSADGRFRFPQRTIEVPDVEAFAVDLDFAVVSVSGVVVDRDTEAPIPYAFVSAIPRAPRKQGVSGGAGPDGRFVLEVEPAPYRMGGRDKDGRYAHGTVDVTVGGAGLTDVRIELARGMRIAGRALDPTGRGVAGVEVQASSTTQDVGGSAETRADGSFEIRGLRSGPYVLRASSGSGLFGFLPSVEAGTLELAVPLQQGGRLMVEAVDTAGVPVPGVWMSVNVDPAVAFVNPGPTNAAGTIEFRVPAGRASLSARKDVLSGSAVVEVGAGETRPVRITMEAR